MPGVPRSRLVAVGCFTAFLGVVSGGMVGVLVAKAVAFLTRAPACTGIPTCDWYLYWVGGAAIGGATLPLLAVRSLRRSRSTDPRQDPAPAGQEGNRGPN